MSEERVSTDYDGLLYRLGTYWLHLQALARALDAERNELLRARRLGLPRDEGLREAREARMRVLSSHLGDPMLDPGFRARAEQYARTRKGLRAVQGERPLWNVGAEGHEQPGQYVGEVLEYLCGWLTRSDLEELREDLEGLIDQATARGERGREVEAVEEDD
jgi:hypothetical protein